MTKIRRLAAAAITATLLSVGCTAEPTLAEREAAYIETVRDMVPELADRSDANLIAIGNDLCDVYDDGSTRPSLLALLIEEAGLDGYSAGALNGAATGALCPEHAPNG